MDNQTQFATSFFKLTIIQVYLALLLSAIPSWSSAGAGPRDTGDDSYRVLAGLVDKGLYELAAKEGSAFLVQFPMHAKAELARYRLAGALFELQRHREALEHFSTLSEAAGFEYRAEAGFRFGQCLLSLERLPEAKAAFEQVRGLGQAYLHGPATFFMAETEFRQGEIEAAERDYQQFLSKYKDAEYLAGARRGLVWCSWKSKRAKETIQRATSFLNSHGEQEGSDEMRILLGEAYLEDEQADEALKSFNQVDAKAFGDARRRGAGFALAAKQEYAAAASEFAMLLRDFPESRFAAEARLQLGLQALRSGNTEAALRALKLATRDKDPEAYFWLAEAERAGGNSKAALDSLESALKLKPIESLRARIHAARGDLLNAMGRNTEALAAYSQGGSDYALYAAAVTSLNQKDTNQALQLVDSLLASQPESKYRLQALLVRGEALFASARLDEAILAFQQVLAQQPDDEQAAQALARIAWSHYQSARLDQALQGFAQLNQEFPGSAANTEGLYMLARVALESGAKERAVSAAKDYLKRYPKGPQSAEVLFAAAQASEGAAALPYLERLIQEHSEHELVAAALLELGDRRSRLGHTEEAMLNYRALIQSQARSKLVPEARYGLGWCLYKQEEFAASAEQLFQVDGHKSASSALRRAALELAVWAASKAANPSAASDAWRAFARLSEDEHERFESLRTVLGAWSQAGRPKEAQSLVHEFLRAVKDPALATRVLLESAYLALESKDVELAERQLRSAQKADPHSAVVAEAAFFVGEARFAGGQHQAAAELYRGAVQEPNPMRANACYKLGFTLMREGQPQLAAEAFGKLVAEHRDSELFGEALFLQGENLFQAEALAQAIECFERLAREAPKHQVLPKALFRLGIAQGRLELWAACESSLTLLARQAPEFENLPEAELWRGRALAAQRKRRAARQAFERVIALDKGELAARARLGLGGLLEAEGQSDAALSEYLKVAFLYAHAEEVAEALFRAGRCLEAQGERAQAIAQYDEILAKHPQAKFAAQAQERLSELGRGN